MATIKAFFLLPQKDNDGRSLAQEISEAEGQLYLRFFAFTCHGTVSGAYRMLDGQYALDEHTAFSLMVAEERLAELEQVLREFRSKTSQESIYLEIDRNVEVRYVT